MNDHITPELYDNLLNFFISEIPLGASGYYNSDTDPITVAGDMDFDQLSSVLDHLQDQGLLKLINCGYDDRSYMFDIQITPKALDHKRHGGFVGQEVLFKQNVEKLILELQTLKPSSVEQADKITSIVGNISSFLGLVLQVS